MIGISKQLRKYFIFIAMLSISFITLISNISINVFFSSYLKRTRSKDDQKVVEYVEKLYEDNIGLSPQSLMSVMHYAYSEAITIRLSDLNGRIIWSSGTPETMHNETRSGKENESNLSFRSYRFMYRESKVGTLDVGRPKSIVSSIEDRQFLSTINGVFAIAFLFSVIISIILSSRVSIKFLKPIYLIKENAKLIENGKYKKLNKVSTNTYELNDLSVSVIDLAEKLDHQESLRKRMTSDIAHELRTPLATLQSYIEAFMDGVWKPDQKKLSIVYDEITRLTKLIKELSDLSIIESDSIKLNKDEINLSVLIESILESYEPLFAKKNIKLKKEIKSDIKFTCDIDKIKQILANILSNAYKYTNENGEVRATLAKLKDNICIIIEDTGIGIPNEDIKRVFERFYRSDLSRNRGTGGTGIGLTITKALVEAHGGSIKIESELGKGTKVVIEFGNLHKNSMFSS